MAEAIAKVKNGSVMNCNTGDTDGLLVNTLLEALTGTNRLNVGAYGRTTRSATNYTAAGQSIDQHLAGIDTALGAGPAAHLMGSASHTIDSLANLNSKITGGGLDFTTATRIPTIHNLGANLRHGSDTLANVNALITGGNLDFDTASRPPSGSASGDLSSNYPGPTVAKVRGYSVQDHAPVDGESLIWKATQSRYEPGVISNNDQVVFSSELTLTTSYQDIAGLTKTFTPSRACIAFVICKVGMRVAALAGALINLYTQLLKDAGAIDAGTCVLVAGWQRNMLTMACVTALAADTEVTIKAQAKKDTSADVYYAGAYGRMMIILLPNVGL